MRPSFLRSLLAMIGTVTALGIAGPPASAEPILHHVHGLAFAPDGKALLVPAHIGLAIYRDGRWSKAPGPTHDFMGFSAAKNAIYTSGHPAPGSALRNPFGLMKSTDGGKTWSSLGLLGEADFHQLAVGYHTSVVYVVNAQPNSRMPQPGIYFTADEGKSWKRSESVGLAAQVISIAVHPAETGTVAVGTLGGLYLSRDFGASFKRLGRNSPVTAVLFDFDGKHLYFVREDADALRRIALDGQNDKTLGLPRLERDFVLYIAQNPAKPDELAIATRQRHAFVSTDAGQNWKQIAREGEGL